MNRLLLKSVVLLLLFFLLAVVFIAIKGQDTEKDLTEGTKNDIIGLVPPEDVMDMVSIKGNVYAGGRDGVHVIDKNTYSVQKLEFTKDVTYVRALLADDQNRLWIGYPEGLLIYNIETGDEIWETEANEIIPDKRINEIVQDSKDRIWVGTWGGAAYLDNGKWNVITEANGLMKNMVNIIIEDQDEGIWFGSYSVKQGGVSYLSNDKWQYFDTQDVLHNGNVTSILQDNQGLVWIGTGLYDRGGVAVLKNENEIWEFQDKIEKEDGLVGEKVRSLFQTKEGTILLGSEYDGLTILKDGRYSYLTTEDGLTHNEIKCFLQDEQGNVWLGTRNGISIIPVKHIKSEKSKD